MFRIIYRFLFDELWLRKKQVIRPSVPFGKQWDDGVALPIEIHWGEVG